MTTYSTPVDSKSGPNCGPTSIATLTGKTLAEVMAYIRKDRGYKANWKGSTRNHRWGSVCPALDGDIGRALTHFAANPVVDQELNERYNKCQIKTVAQVLPQDKAYLILTGSHAQACVNGLIFDQNTSAEGDSPKTFWGGKKKVALIITVDRLTQLEETEPMTTVIPMIVPETLVPALDEQVAEAAAAIANLEAAFQSTNGEAKAKRDTANVSKIEAYCELIYAILSQKIRKGTKRSGQFRAALEAAGVSKACAKRYMEIGQAAAKLDMVKDRVGVTIADVFAENDIKTEAALKNVCFPTVEKSLVEKLVEAAQAGTETDDEAIQALLDAVAAINPAAQDVADTLVAAINRKVAA
jgi:hypothetical protein